MPLTYEHKSWMLSRLSRRGEWVSQPLPEWFGDRSKMPKRQKGESAPLWSAAFPLKLTILFNERAENAHWELMNAAKLVIAHDLGIEKSLRAQNPNTDFPSLNPSTWFVPWNLTTDFNGFHIDEPKRFSLEPHTDKDNKIIGFDLGMNSTGRENMQNQLDAIEGWKHDPGAPLETDELEREDIAQILGPKAKQAVTSGGRTWVYGHILTGSPVATIFSIRSFLENNLGLEPGQYVAMDHGPDNIVVAADRDIVTRALDARAATFEIMDAIRYGARRADGTRMTAPECRVFLEQRLARGADLRTVDPQAATGQRGPNGDFAYTLADVMLAYDAFTLLVAMRDLQGVQKMRDPIPYKLAI